ncbi:hypothetical protein SNEBB_001893 [Seison nebaliae]|nr:hypothetical protein SNEBB_001893 [Seison nebaliae]
MSKNCLMKVESHSARNYSMIQVEATNDIFRVQQMVDEFNVITQFEGEPISFQISEKDLPYNYQLLKGDIPFRVFIVKVNESNQFEQILRIFAMKKRRNNSRPKLKNHDNQNIEYPHENHRKNETKFPPFTTFGIVQSVTFDENRSNAIILQTENENDLPVDHVNVEERKRLFDAFPKGRELFYQWKPNQSSGFHHNKYNRRYHKNTDNRSPWTLEMNDIVICSYVNENLKNINDIVMVKSIFKVFVNGQIISKNARLDEQTARIERDRKRREYLTEQENKLSVTDYTFVEDLNESFSYLTICDGLANSYQMIINGESRLILEYVLHFTFDRSFPSIRKPTARTIRLYISFSNIKLNRSMPTRADNGAKVFNGNHLLRGMADITMLNEFEIPRIEPGIRIVIQQSQKIIDEFGVVERILHFDNVMTNNKRILDSLILSSRFEMDRCIMESNKDDYKIICNRFILPNLVNVEEGDESIDIFDKEIGSISIDDKKSKFHKKVDEFQLVKIREKGKIVGEVILIQHSKIAILLKVKSIDGISFNHYCTWKSNSDENKIYQIASYSFNYLDYLTLNEQFQNLQVNRNMLGRPYFIDFNRLFVILNECTPMYTQLLQQYHETKEKINLHLRNYFYLLGIVKRIRWKNIYWIIDVLIPKCIAGFAPAAWNDQLFRCQDIKDELGMEIFTFETDSLLFQSGFCILLQINQMDYSNVDVVHVLSNDLRIKSGVADIMEVPVKEEDHSKDFLSIKRKNVTYYIDVEDLRQYESGVYSFNTISFFSMSNKQLFGGGLRKKEKNQMKKIDYRSGDFAFVQQIMRFRYHEQLPSSDVVSGEIDHSKEISEMITNSTVNHLELNRDNLKVEKKPFDDNLKKDQIDDEMDGTINIIVEKEEIGISTNPSNGIHGDGIDKLNESIGEQNSKKIKLVINGNEMEEFEKVEKIEEGSFIDDQPMDIDTVSEENVDYDPNISNISSVLSDVVEKVSHESIDELLDGCLELIENDGDGDIREHWYDLGNKDVDLR